MNYLGKYFLDKVKNYLKDDQTLFIAGATDDELCWYIRGSFSPQPEPRLRSNAEETDTRAWVHVKNSDQSRILLESCDTDVYHIGVSTTTTWQQANSHQA